MKELFDSIAPQNAENSTVANSLPLFLKYSVKCLFFKRLYQTIENLKYKYVGDPAAMVHDGKVYIYGGHDECPPPNEHYLINEWCVFSSPDLKTWTEHPVPLKAKDFSWAKGEAWASQVH